MNKHQIYVQVGDILRNKYRVISHLASGGMSEVYIVEEIGSEQNIWAAKISNLNSKFAQKLMNEAKLLSHLHQPNLPFVVDFFSCSHYFYLILEYINGIPLSNYVEEKDFNLSLDFILDVGIQLCDVLYYLHHEQQEPIIYRDIKPGNILITENNTVKLIDFGIARKFQEGRMKDTVQVGTVGFAAPEQFEKEQTDTRTDLFSLGALLYYLISRGKYVYIAQKPIQALRDDLPKFLSLCINELVKLKRDERVQHVSEAKYLLIHAAEQLETDRKRAQVEQKRRQWLRSKILYMVLGSCLVFGLCYIIFLLTNT